MHKKTASDEPPIWAQKAIWYQIFVERFRNGDPTNDPSPQTIEGAVFEPTPENWSVTPWGQAWYTQEEWALEAGFEFHTSVQMRRYGGDLQGVLDKIPYLVSLGINAVYFNPLNDAPSLHKYDARNYHHIDVNFGPDPAGDMIAIQNEIPSKPETWIWTEADKLFIEIVKKLHEAGIKVILDFSWNHTGRSFWAFKDILEKGADSEFINWFEVNGFQDSSQSQDVIDYQGWLGFKSLPELKKVRLTEKFFGYPYEGYIVPEVKDHIFSVCRRWMDPKGDGSLDGGIDGMRLDVAEHVPMGFWREFRYFVRNINPDFYLVGENWWSSFPDILMDPTPWVKGDVFDAVMHYHWYKPTRGYFRQSEDGLDLYAYVNELVRIFGTYKPTVSRAMMNLTASHDSPRFWTSISNFNKYKFNSRTGDNPGYKAGKPDEHTIQLGKILLFHQFTFIGSPHIWNGDELGMWGADDPDCRKPLWWEDIDFEVEKSSFYSEHPYEIKPEPNLEILEYYKSLIAMRKNFETLSLASVEFEPSLLAKGLLAYKRDDLGVVINGSTEIISTHFKASPPIFMVNGVSAIGDFWTFPPYSGILIRLE